MANIGIGDLSAASSQISSALNNLDSSATSSLSNMIKEANTNWDTNLGSETTTSMKDALESWMRSTIEVLNNLKSQFDSIAQSIAEGEKASFSAGPSVSHSSAVTGGDIRNASDVNGSFKSEGVANALSTGTSNVTENFSSAISHISGIDFGMHQDLKRIEEQMVSTLTNHQQKISQVLSEWNNTEKMQADNRGEAYSQYIASSVSSLGQ